MEHVQYPEVGICGLSCRLCPHYYIVGESRCGGCKSQGRMQVGCPFITCARKKGIEFCWQCEEQEMCQKWAKHRETGKRHDSFVSYQALDDNIAFVKSQGIDAFVQEQMAKERLLRKMLAEFNDGRSKTYYCIAATVMSLEELRQALARALEQSSGADIKARAAILHAILDAIAQTRGYHLKLRR